MGMRKLQIAIVAVKYENLRNVGPVLVDVGAILKGGIYQTFTSLTNGFLLFSRQVDFQEDSEFRRY